MLWPVWAARDHPSRSIMIYGLKRSTGKLRSPHDVVAKPLSDRIGTRVFHKLPCCQGSVRLPCCHGSERRS